MFFFRFNFLNFYKKKCPVLYTLETNSRRRANVYSDIAEMFLFLANLKATKVEIVEGIELLKEAYPEDVDPKLADKLNIFICRLRKINIKPSRYRYRRAIYFLVAWRPLRNYAQGKN